MTLCPTLGHHVQPIGQPPLTHQQLLPRQAVLPVGIDLKSSNYCRTNNYQICFSAIFNSPGYQSLLQQMTGNPDVMQNLLEGPQMQSLMEAMANDPQMAELVRLNDLVIGNQEANVRLVINRCSPAIQCLPTIHNCVIRSVRECRSYFIRYDKFYKNACGLPLRGNVPTTVFLRCGIRMSDVH